MKPPILIRSVTLAAFARTIIAGRPLLRSTSNNTGLSPGGLGSADIFDDSTKLSLYGKPWDRAEEHKVLIRYCYRNPTIRSSVQTFIEGGINKWKTALGERSEEKGHAVAFEEAMEPGTEPDTEQPAYCAKAGASIDEYYDDDWNPKVPFDTLVINEVTGNTGSSSTIGLGQESKPWQNILDVGLYWNYVDRALTTAHELGHVLGMAHEHQRTDRKKYIVYLCTNLRDYDAVRHQLQADNAAGRGKHPPSGKPWKMHDLCNNAAAAIAYGFSAIEFIEGVATDPKDKVVGHGDYDVRSIMHYMSDSGVGANSPKPCEIDAPENCVLGFWKDPNNFSAGWEARKGFNEISENDIEWVKKMYPWNKPAGAAASEF